MLLCSLLLVTRTTDFPVSITTSLEAKLARMSLFLFLAGVLLRDGNSEACSLKLRDREITWSLMYGSKGIPLRSHVGIPEILYYAPYSHLLPLFSLLNFLQKKVVVGVSRVRRKWDHTESQWNNMGPLQVYWAPISIPRRKQRGPYRFQ